MSTKTIFLVLLCLPFTVSAQISKSELAEGDLYKFGVSSEGIHILTYESLEQIGINPTTIDPRAIQILSAGGGILPEEFDRPRIQDLVEIPIQIMGEEDGSFDRTDHILFYGEGPDPWHFDEVNQVFHQLKNPYETRNFYFIKIAIENGRRIQISSTVENGEYETDTYLDRQHYEKETFNLLHFAGNANLQGSGRKWLGEIFRTEREIDFSPHFDFRGLDITSSIFVHTEFVARSAISSTFNLTIGDKSLSQSISSTNVSEIETNYARDGVIKEEVQISEANPMVTLSYPSQGNNNEGWLDFIELNFRRSLAYRNEQFWFADPRSVSFGSTKYRLSDLPSDVQIWDVSDVTNPGLISTEISDGQTEFSTSSESLRQFVAFKPEDALPVEPIGKIPNQNLHSLRAIEYLVIYHPDFEDAANKLAEFRKEKNKFSVQCVNIDQIYNEFSSGRVDPTAIRDFARYLYDQENGLKYMLLFGDGSFDYKHILTDLQDESFIPVFETENSFHPINAYPTDDYFALLEDDEGGTLRGDLDIAVGRLPVRTSDEANLVVDKIIQYQTSEKTLGNWRTNMLFVADDEDNNRHLNGADLLAEDMRTQFPAFNINKIYIDAFAQDNTPGGVFNFKATEAINQNLFQGQLVVNYLGHGGSNGWAQERILQIEDIRNTWNNADKLPLLITATCSFAGYDNPAKITAGEHTLTNPSGGAIALFTTVRAVYASSNERLTRAVFNHLFAPVDGGIPPIGDILKNAKNSNPSDAVNARKFTLLGDPAMHLALPKYTVKTLQVNGKSAIAEQLDTLKSLAKVTVSGEIQGPDGQLASNFNGKIYPTIYDKAVTLKTLAQDKGSSVRDFTLQKSVIFKGLASVTNGRFEFTFVVPKDINYVFGNGKISYYAEDGSPFDAAGAFNEIVVGGTSSQSIDDDEGPEIEIYFDDENFIFGGATNTNPTLLLKLSDDNGINVIGNSIGHDLTATLDNDFQNSIILNDFYESEQDNYRLGAVNYPLNNIALGKHTISIKAWDIANNSTVSVSEFVVVDDAKSGLDHVLNYPNPFSESTSFQFEHQFPNLDIDIKVEILTVSGRLVATLEQTVKASSTLSRDIKWDGRDAFGDPLANGIYVYRVTVKADGGGGRILKNRSDLEKLVLIR